MPASSSTLTETSEEVELRVRPIFARSEVTGEITALIDEVIAEPGELTQSLCSPWQNDYRECGCYYWAQPARLRQRRTDHRRHIGNNWMARSRDSQALRAGRPTIRASSTTRTSSGTGRDCCGSSSRAATMTELFELHPRTPHAHLVDSGIGRHLFLPNGSRLYDVDAALGPAGRAERAGDERRWPTC